MSVNKDKKTVKNIKIMDYSGRKTTVKIIDFDNVVKMTVEVISGDEILKVLFKNYETEQYDSCSFGRTMDFVDDEYCIYDTTKGINHLLKWSKRKSSYYYDL